MDRREGRLPGKSANFEKDVFLASQRSSWIGKPDLRVQGQMAGEAHVAPLSEDADLEPAPPSAVEWMEVQLLECENLARLNGLRQLAALLDRALDVLAKEAAEVDAASTSGSKGEILPFRAR